MRYSRPYFYDDRARRGRSPMDERLGIEGTFSRGVRRILTRLAVLLPYAKASELADELARIKVSDSSLWEIVQHAGRHRSSAWHPVTSQKHSHSERMGLALDGCMMHVRGEGWKEAKVGVVFEVEDVPSPDPEDVANDVACTEQSCVIHLGGPEGLSNQLVAEARARHFAHATQQAVIGDGAEWIWKIAQCDYPQAAHIVDWYHACQHLHTAATLLFPHTHQTDQLAELAAWLAHHKQVLYGGGADLVALAITAIPAAHAGKNRASLETEAAYFDARHERMQYADFRQAGLPIGSGVVEATAKQVKHRMSAAGMRWSRAGADRLLPFLAAELSGTFAPYWNRVCP